MSQKKYNRIGRPLTINATKGNGSLTKTKNRAEETGSQLNEETSQKYQWQPERKREKGQTEVDVPCCHHNKSLQNIFRLYQPLRGIIQQLKNTSIIKTKIGKSQKSTPLADCPMCLFNPSSSKSIQLTSFTHQHDTFEQSFRGNWLNLAQVPEPHGKSKLGKKVVV